MSAQARTISGMPARYASALFELAREKKSTDQVAGDLNRFAAMLDDSADLTRLVRSPVFSADVQINALDALFAKAEIDGLAANFVKLAARNRRLFAVRQMITAFNALVAEARGEVAAQVVSAEKLTAEQITALKAALKQAEGREVVLDRKVDPSIIGGLVVTVGSRMVDNSLKTKLQAVKIAMKGVG